MLALHPVIHGGGVDSRLDDTIDHVNDAVANPLGAQSLQSDLAIGLSVVLKHMVSCQANGC